MTVVGFSQPSTNRRLQTTILHKRFGVFRYSQVLEGLGITAPFSQIAAIGRVITWLSKAQSLPYIEEEPALVEWMTNAIGAALQDNRALLIEPLHLLVLRSQKHVAWNTYGDFAELLNYRCGPTAYTQAGSRLRSHGFSVGVPEISALAGTFVLGCLPQAVRSFDPVRGAGHEHAWLQTVFYRFALRLLVADREQQWSLDLLAGPDPGPPSDSGHTKSGGDVRMLERIPDLVEQLPTDSRTAIELYFGFHGREHALVELAQRLNCSEYIARTTLIDAIAEVAVRLGIKGPLEANEYKILQCVVEKGMDVNATAKYCGIAPNRVRTLMTSVGRKFADGLRTRTRTPILDSVRQRRIREMATRMVVFEELTDAEVLSALKDLRKTPELRKSSSDEFEAKLGSAWIPVARVRALLLNDAGALKTLSGLNAPLEWVVIPDHQLERADLNEDFLRTRELLRRSGERVWTNSTVLFERCCAEAPVGTVAFLPQKREETVESIYRTLIGIVQILDAARPVAGPHVSLRLRVERSAPDRVAVYWEHGTAERSYDLSRLLIQEAKAVGEFNSIDAAHFAKATVEELFALQAVLPGFSIAEEHTAQTLWLARAPGIFEAQNTL